MELGSVLVIPGGLAFGGLKDWGIQWGEPRHGRRRGKGWGSGWGGASGGGRGWGSAELGGGRAFLVTAGEGGEVNIQGRYGQKGGEMCGGCGGVCCNDPRGPAFDGHLFRALEEEGGFEGGAANNERGEGTEEVKSGWGRDRTVALGQRVEVGGVREEKVGVCLTNSERS